MSTREKIGLGQLVTIALTCAGLLIMVGRYQNQLETCQKDVSDIKVEVSRIVKVSERQEERSTTMTSSLQSLSSQIHGIQTKMGMERARGGQ